MWALMKLEFHIVNLLPMTNSQLCRTWCLLVINIGRLLYIDYVVRVAGYGRELPEAKLSACFTSRNSPTYYQRCRKGGQECSRNRRREHPE